MKILKLRLKNIHSIKGEFLIDFTSEPLVSSGLFAITGVTGAGKSTLLDAITLALFNKIPRFAANRQGAISKTEIESLGAVITHFCDDAYAEIDYMAGKSSYRSTWRISKTRTGNLKDYEMSLADLESNSFFDLKKGEVPTKNEEILGMKYEQFIRSVVLSQGDFARLLKSDDKERAQLLEDITGSRIYREIGKRVFELSRESDKNIELLRQEVKGIECLPEDVAIEKTKALEQNKITNTMLQQKIDHSRQMLDKVEKKLQFLKKAENINNEFIKSEEEKRKFADKDTQLQRHTALNPYRESFANCTIYKSRITELKDSVQTLHIKIEQAENQNQQLLEKISKLIRKDITPENALQILQDFEEEILTYDNKLSHISEQGFREKSSFIQFVKDNAEYIDLSFSTNINPSLIYESLNSRITVLEADPLIATNDISKIMEALNQVQQDYKLYTEQYAKVDLCEKLLADNREIESWIEKQLPLSEQQDKVIYTIVNRINELQHEESSLREEKDKWLQLASLDEHRSRLEDGKPCPLCGSVHHPYADSLPVYVLDVELKLKKNLEERKSLEIKKQELEKNITVLKTTLEAKTQQKKDNALTISNISAELKETGLTTQVLTDKIKKVEAEESRFKKEISTINELKTLKTALVMIEKINTLVQEHNAVSVQRKSLYVGKDIKIESQSLKNQWNEIRENLLKYRSVTIDTIKQIDESESVFLKISSQLLTKIQQLGYEDIASAYTQILPDELYRKLNSEKEAINTTSLNIQAEQQHNREALNELKDTDASEEILNDLQDSIRTCQAEKDALHEENGKLIQELKHNSEMTEKRNVLHGKIMAMLTESEALFKLNYYIGDKEGNKYAKFAQNLNLRQLIQLSNLRLQKLTDRYLLKETDIEEDFKVMDLYQMDTVRSVRTLSGGETFIVSLALALSLSDMASNNVKLESLFIDEGFGTLDQESLETALITLEKLQSESNRTIGIISHVESLKERITTQIRVNKNSQGYSVIEIV